MLGNIGIENQDQTLPYSKHRTDAVFIVSCSISSISHENERLAPGAAKDTTLRTSHMNLTPSAINCPDVDILLTDEPISNRTETWNVKGQIPFLDVKWHSWRSDSYVKCQIALLIVT